MREASRHILFLATEYAAGMRPYANAIIHALWQQGDHVVIVTKDKSGIRDFYDLPQDSVTWIQYPHSKLGKLAFRFHPSQLLESIEQVVQEHGIQLIYSLTGELVLVNSIRRLQHMAPVLYTIHDAVGHDSKFNHWITWLKHKIFVSIPQHRLIKFTHYQITNSKSQQLFVSSNYPYHKVYYAPFPALISDEIAEGRDAVPELKDIADGYILFFGNLQLYKGVHLLYESYLTHPDMQRRQLVIAGSGYIYFNRKAHLEQQITFINRFIDDRELHDLFSRASIVVYPYISATQSGVTSIAAYFGKPMVLSDLPFFKETCDGIEGIHFFAAGDSESLATAISRCMQQTSSSSRLLYDRQYSPQIMTDTLNNILSEFLD